MVRAPCCEKMGLKKGPWTPEEDQVLIDYIQRYGHGNWRALPKQAGLLRCGKSCRLRWINYLRPDIKRGNFSREEEDTIIQLHEMWGNRWSAIAAKLPGRTDNEIKNVWHTHLKKRLRNQHTSKPESKFNQKAKTEPELANSYDIGGSEGTEYRPISPQQCSSDISSVTTATTTTTTTTTTPRADAINMRVKIESRDEFPKMDENFWLEVLSSDDSSTTSDFPMVDIDPELQFPFCSLVNGMEPVHGSSSNTYESMDFWNNLLTRVGELPEELKFD